MRRLRLLSLILLICTPAVVGQTPSPQYTVTELGDFNVQAINSSATVVGLRINNTQTAVLWRNGVLTDITPPATAPTRAFGGVAFGINDLDQAVGEVRFCDVNELGSCVNSRGRGFIFDRVTQTHTLLGTLGGRDSHARAINNAGQVVGTSDTPGPPPGNVGDMHAFIFQNGAFEDIGAITGGNSQASNINATGQVTGSVSPTAANGPNEGAFIYSAGSFVFFLRFGRPSDINNAGQVVGTMNVQDGGVSHAFLFSAGAVQDLGKLSTGHSSAQAFAVNNPGHVVGVSSPSWMSSIGERAFIFRAGVMQDLNNLIPANSGWVLSRAVDINDAGQIVGDGFKNGEPRAFLLTPAQPMLMTEPNTTKAVALESVALLRDPFSLQARHPLSADGRTRLTIIARNIDIVAGENISPPAVQAENAQQQLIDLPVEFIGKIPTAPWLTQITVRLPDQLNTSGEVQLRISFRGLLSNPGSITIAP